MAIEKDKLMELLNSEDAAEKKADSLLEMFNSDVEAQLTAIKLNREQIKEEKKQEMAKKQALAEQLETIKEENAKLTKQLADASPEAVQQIWEKKLQDAANVYEKKALEMQEVNDAQKTRIQELETIQLIHECEQEFNKAIVGKNIAPDALQDFKDYVLGFECCKFSRKPYGEGKTILATNDGLTIKQVTENACNSTFGKNCMLNDSFGGGAEGGAKTIQVANNPWKKETFNLTKQAQIKSENPEMAKQLMSAAGF